jgi:hypothetical protein
MPVMGALEIIANLLLSDSGIAQCRRDLAGNGESQGRIMLKRDIRLFAAVEASILLAHAL